MIPSTARLTFSCSWIKTSLRALIRCAITRLEPMDVTTTANTTMATSVSKSEKPLSELVAPLRKYSQSGEINSKVADAAAVLEAVRAKFPDFFELDGVSVDRWDAEGWWCNVRMSNTEPLVRLNLEAKTPELMAAKRDEMLALIRA